MEICGVLRPLVMSTKASRFYRFRFDQLPYIDILPTTLQHESKTLQTHVNHNRKIIIINLVYHFKFVKEMIEPYFNFVLFNVYLDFFLAE